jgi:hypothetical protein
VSRASSVKHGHDGGHRIPAQRTAVRRARLRNRLLLAGGAIVAVVAVTVAIVLVSSGSAKSPEATPPGEPTGTALASTVREVTTVPGSVLDAVGGGNLVAADIGSPTAVGGGYLTPVTGPALTAGGKPEVLYMGAEFCPYCAAVRWPLIVALSRFGTFAGLAASRSGIANGAGQAEPYPATPTWTFSGSRYSSDVLAFTAVELNSNVPDPASGGYTVLQAPTAAQQATLATYDTSGGIPFIDIGNRYVQLSTLVPFGPQDLQGATWGEIAVTLRDPSSALGAEIDASANYLTAAICAITGNQPASACTPAIRALGPRLGR